MFVKPISTCRREDLQLTTNLEQNTVPYSSENVENHHDCLIVQCFTLNRQ